MSFFQKIFVTVLFLSISATTFAQNRAVGKFFRNHKHTEDAVHFTLPGFLTWAGIGIAKGFVETEEEKLGLKLAQKLGTTKFLVLDGNTERARASVPVMLADLQQRHGYEQFVEVRRKDGERVSVMIKANEKKIKRFFVLVHSEDELMMLSARTRLKMKKIKKIIEKLMEEEDFKPREEAEKVVVPVA